MNMEKLMNITKVGEMIELVKTEQAIYRRTKNGLQKVKTLTENIEVNQRIQIHRDQQQ